MDEQTRSCLLRNRLALEQDIKTSYIMDHLISEEVLNLDDEQKVKVQATQKERAALLIDLILKKDNYAVISFYNALLNEGYKELAALLQDGLPIISTSNKSSMDGLTPYDTVQSPAFCQEIQKYLSQDSKTKKQLLPEGRCLAAPRLAVALKYNGLSKSLVALFVVFCTLERLNFCSLSLTLLQLFCGFFDYAHKEMDFMIVYVQTVLCEGGVPQRPVVFVDRPELVQTIRNEFYKLKKEPGWIIISGMAGCGKSVLAAEALRNHGVLTECFPGGVHWLAVGKQDRAGILVKLQNLCSRFNQESHTYPSPPLNIEEARDRLRFLMARKYPRSLLVLDDVWDNWVLKSFDVQCRVLITSRDRSIAEAVSGNQFHISVQSGLSNDKGLEILARFANMKASYLPEEAHSIVQECKGSPLVVSLIGALLREFPNRWSYYLKQLQGKQFKRIRKSSSYDYEALDEAMAISIDILEKSHREYYKDLSILKKDVKVPTKVLCILWELDVEEVEDILQVFVNKSLLFCDRNKRSFQYYLHDLQLDFLIEQNHNQLSELHAKMVRQYQKTYKKLLPSPSDEDSMYWYSFLANHMARANLNKELYSLMFSVDWIKAKTEMMGPAQLINDFVEFRHILDEENSTVRENFQEFLSLKGHLMVQKPFPDIVQLGLCQPDSSEVYRQAKLKAMEKAKNGDIYLEWINKATLQNSSRLVVQLHCDAVFHACFSHDELKIASCGADKTLKIFKSESGEKLLELVAHDDEVLCCAFSPDDKLVATCSADTKVKVWNSLTGNLIHTLHEHNEQVNCCQFSHSQQMMMLVTCSNDTLVKTWDLKGTSCKNTLFGHEAPVNHCCFSPDDQYLASCSDDGTVKLWRSGNMWKCFDVKEQCQKSDNDEEEEVLLKGCLWSSDGIQVLATAKSTLFIYNVISGDLISEITMSRYSTIQSCDISPTRPLLAVALSHNSVELWDMVSLKRVADCSGHLSWVHCVQFSHDGSKLLSCSDDQTVRLWETNKVHSSSAVSLIQCMDAIFQQNETFVLVSDNKKHLQLINGETGHVVHQSDAQESRIHCCCLNQDINLVAFGCGDGILKVGMKSAKFILQNIGWKRQQFQKSLLIAVGLENGIVKVLELPSGKIIRTLPGHTKSVQQCQFTHNEQVLISSSDDATIRVWNWHTGECKVLEGHIEQVKNFKLLRGSQLLSWSFDGTMKVWNFITGELLKNFHCHDGAVLSCDASPDGNKVVSASADKSAKIWSLKNTMPPLVLAGHNACVRSCRFTWDNEYLATGDDNGEIRIWRVRDGSLLHICPNDAEIKDSKHGGWVTDLHFSPNSRILVSTGGYIKWWDMNTGESLQTFYTNGTNLKSIHVSSDFKTFVTIDNIGILYILKMIT